MLILTIYTIEEYIHLGVFPANEFAQNLKELLNMPAHLNELDATGKISDEFIQAFASVPVKPFGFTESFREKGLAILDKRKGSQYYLSQRFPYDEKYNNSVWHYLKTQETNPTTT